MKKIICLSLLSASSLFAEYTNQIVQILEDGTEQYLYDIPSSGSEQSPTIIIGQSIFQLHTTHNTSGVSYELDEKIINGYNPKVTVTIDSEDPNVYQDEQRYTRVGKPYRVNYDISGILPQSEVIAARAVILEKEHVATQSTGSTSTSYTAKTIDKNGLSSDSDEAEMGTASEIKNVYRFYQNVDPNEGYASSIETATVRIFPNATGSLLKADEGGGVGNVFGQTVESYREFPEIKINVEKIYPGALVVLRIYPTEDNADPQNDIIMVTTGTSGTYSNTFDQKEVAEKLENIDIVATKEKVKYNAELIERSVYGDVILAQGQFELQQKALVIKGQLIGAE